MTKLTSWLLLALMLVAIPLTLAATPRPSPKPVADCTCVGVEGVHEIDIAFPGGMTQGVALNPEGDGRCNESCLPITNQGCKWKAVYYIGWPSPGPGPFVSTSGKRSIQVVHGGIPWEAATDEVRFTTNCGTSVVHGEAFTDLGGNKVAEIVFHGQCKECKEPERQ